MTDKKLASVVITTQWVWFFWCFLYFCHQGKIEKYIKQHQIYSSLTTLVPLRRPVLRAAMRPTFLPWDLYRLTVDALPMCWWLPPPWGCSTGFIHTPLTLGQLLRLTLYLWNALPAFNRGLSIRPPPATIPTNHNNQTSIEPWPMATSMFSSILPYRQQGFISSHISIFWAVFISAL